MNYSPLVGGQFKEIALIALFQEWGLNVGEIPEISNHLLPSVRLCEAARKSDSITEFQYFIPKPKILLEKSLCKPPNIKHEPYLLCMQLVEVAGGVCGLQECCCV